MDKNVLDALEASLKKALLKREEKLNVAKFDNKSKKNSIIIVPNLNDPNFRFVAVANDLRDSKISSDIVNDFVNWFSFLKEDYKNDMVFLESILIEKFKNSKDYFKDNEQDILPSFAGVIVGANETIIVKIRDVEMYSYKNAKIELLNDVGYKSTFLTDDLEVKTKVIDNKDYITLIMLSNGEYGNIIDDEVKVITKDTDRDKLAEELFQSGV